MADDVLVLHRVRRRRHHGEAAHPAADQDTSGQRPEPAAIGRESIDSWSVKGLPQIPGEHGRHPDPAPPCPNASEPRRSTPAEQPVTARRSPTCCPPAPWPTTSTAPGSPSGANVRTPPPGCPVRRTRRTKLHRVHHRCPGQATHRRSELDVVSGSDAAAIALGTAVAKTACEVWLRDHKILATAATSSGQTARRRCRLPALAASSSARRSSTRCAGAGTPSTRTRGLTTAMGVPRVRQNRRWHDPAAGRCSWRLSATRRAAWCTSSSRTRRTTSHYCNRSQALRLPGRPGRVLRPRPDPAELEPQLQRGEQRA